MQSGGCEAGLCFVFLLLLFFWGGVFFVCFTMHIHYKNSLYLPGKVRIGVARPIPLPDDDEEYEESPPDTARYNGEPLLKDAAQDKRGNFNQIFRSLLCPNSTT